MLTMERMEVLKDDGDRVNSDGFDRAKPSVERVNNMRMILRTCSDGGMMGSILSELQ